VPADAPAIAEIYNDAVLHTTAIWNDVTVDAVNREAWLAQRQAGGFPVIVAVHDRLGVAGYASYGPWRAFDGYRYTVENSVYVHPAARRLGTARMLMTALIGMGCDDGLHTMVAAIEAQNHASIALHESLGFTETGRMPQVGCKFGRWLDLVFLQRQLTDFEPR
jgi:phosphinothricin acetyltransferase